MVVAKVLFGAEGTHAGHLSQAIGAGPSAQPRPGVITQPRTSTVRSAPTYLVPKTDSVQFAYVVLRRDVAATAHIDQAVAIIQDSACSGFIFTPSGQAQRLRAHQKLIPRMRGIKIGDTPYIETQSTN